MGKITYWKKSHRATVYPHLELEQRSYTQEEMRDLVEKLKVTLPELNIHIYNQSTYCYELNGPWNVCFSVQEKHDPKKKIKISYTYIIRSCDDFNKTFGCPLFFPALSALFQLGRVNEQTTVLTKELNEPLFNMIESKLMELMPNAKKVDYFDT